MTFIDAPSNFFIGRAYDPAADKVQPDDVVYYDSQDLTTHGLVVGMTGSGKTGLCIGILEEAILDGIPAIIVDPKGDITNLLLTFPHLQPSDFEPWIDQDEARRNNLDVATMAAQKAELWRKGLTDIGIDSARMLRLKNGADYAIYTPGSDSGLPISILASLRAPKHGFEGQEEPLREQISGLVTAILSLAGIAAAPTQDREHVLVSNIVEYNWRNGTDLTLEDLITQIQQPPFEKIGVLPVEKYFPEKDRFALVMKMNNVIASPSFQLWLKGVPMDMQNLLYTPEGKPRVSIFYIAHLSDSERMFVMTLVLETLIAWMRNQAGTSSLRAILYVDEIFGYFPPVANPPSKEPLLRLLKQARAFGVGVLLATQNPVDIDYKGLSNIGTWFIGRLQSDGDRNRIISGLKEAAAAGDMELSALQQLIAQVKSRVFLMRNIHDKGKATLFSTRWCMNYLAGPLTRQQIDVLMADRRAAVSQQIKAQPTPKGAAVSIAGQTVGSDTPGTLPRGYSDKQPVVSGIDQFFLPATINAADSIRKWEQDYRARADNPEQAMLGYQPVLLAQASIRFDDRKSKVRAVKDYAYHVTDIGGSGFVQWDRYPGTPVNRRDLDSRAKGSAIYAEIPAPMMDAKRLRTLEDDLIDTLYKNTTLKVPYNPQFDVYGSPDDQSGAFEAAVRQAAREARDNEIQKIKDAVGRKLDALEKRQDTKTRELESDQARANSGTFQGLASAAEAALSLLGGRRSTSSISRVGRAFMRRGELSGEVQRTKDELADIDKTIETLKQDMEAQLAAAQQKADEAATVRTDYEIRPARSDIQIDVYGIGWVPVWVFQSDGRASFAAAVG